MVQTIFDFYIDRGGTFTDVFYRSSAGDEGVVKLLSEDPANYDDAPREAIKRVVSKVADYHIRTIRMGTTVSTNALLERQGAKTAFVTSKGFKDLLEIGYQNRPKIFDLDIKKAKQLYSEVLELDERIYLSGLENEFDEESVKAGLLKLKESGVESLAIALIHSYKDPSHEVKVKQVAEELGFKEISLSSELVPMIKYLPRASTTVIDAYLAPIIKRYIENFKAGFEDGLDSTELLFMKSDGSLCDETEFRGFNSILSGPAGGVTALQSIYQGKALIGFDMGGTSTDVTRYAGDLNLSFDSEIEGLLLQSPQLDINTIAAGGGSRLFYENGMFRVGPESAGSHPGPVCYKKNGYLAITDANLVLKRLDPAKFPKVFGPQANEALDYKAAYKAFEKLIEKNDLGMTVEEVAAGFIKVANETMARPIREVSSAKGFDVKNHNLVCFGGAASQHACAIAKLLGIKKVIIHKYSGILSAYGISLAQKSSKKQKAFGDLLSKRQEIDEIVKELKVGAIEFEVSLILRYQGTDTKFLLNYTDEVEKVFKENYIREFGFNLDREIICDDVIVSHCEASSPLDSDKEIASSPTASCNDNRVIGPKLITEDTTTIYLEENCVLTVNENGDYEIAVDSRAETKLDVKKDPINLAIFANRFMSIAEQMGKTLERTSISTNIKERRDFSCAIFNKDGDLIANAPHQPVHLGSMGYALKKQIEINAFKSGSVILSNHPVMGGSHLPDLTVISPVFDEQGQAIFYVANRAHHADIGGISPGSMPSFSTSLDEEGVAVKSFALVENGEFQEESLRELFQESRLLEDNISDLRAQIAANNNGIKLLKDLIKEYDQETVVSFMEYILENSSQAVSDLLESTIKEDLEAFDFLDNGAKINLKISYDKKKQKAIFDFTGTHDELDSNLNTPVAVLSSAILYCLRAIINRDIPLNQGFLKPIEIIIPKGSILNPSENKAVVAGNVQTSQRIVDVIFKAFGICGASQGCMNNVIFGNKNFGYYETIGGGAGAGKGFDGMSGVHTHMTNTRITDPEILESRYPVILKEFSFREDSGGKGKYQGGNGLVRHFKFLDALDLSLLTERRVYAPYGLHGAHDGAQGENWLIVANGQKEKLAAKVSLELESGDELKLLTPGGGGYFKNEN